MTKGRDVSAEIKEETSILEAPASDLPASSEQVNDPLIANSGPMHDPLIGRVLFGKIEIRSLIAEGNRGRVYKAWHTDLNLFVAVKFLHQQFVDKPDKVLRFKHEAKAASSIAHSSIVKVYDYGFTENSQPFIVMEFIEDGTLADWIKTQPMSLFEFYAIFVQLADAVSYAHKQGIFHRDLKPENILLKKTEAGLKAKVSDWGIAKVVFANEMSPEFTGTGDVLGSPAYMSPEQCLGQVVDARSDIYSLACVMHEYLSGAVPFAGRNSFECMRMHIEKEAPELVLRSEEVLPYSLSRLIKKCLQKDADHRLQSAEELEELIEKIAAGNESEALALLSKSARRSDLLPKQKLFISLLVLLVPLLAVWSCFKFMEPKPGAADRDEGNDAIRGMAGPRRPELQPVFLRGEADRKAASDPESFAIQELEDCIYNFDLAKKYFEFCGNLKLAELACNNAVNARRMFQSGAFPQSQKPQIHLLSFEHGNPLKRFDPRGTASVHLSAKNAPIVLALSSSQEIRWTIERDSGVDLKQIILIGNAKSSVTNAGFVPVKKIDEKEGSFGHINFTRGLFSDEKSSQLKSLANGAEIATWQSAESAGKDSWFVGPEAGSWKAQMVLAGIMPSRNTLLVAMGGRFARSLPENAIHMTDVFVDTTDGSNSLYREYGTLLLPESLFKFLGARTPNVTLSTKLDESKPTEFAYESKPIVETSSGAKRYFSVGTNSVCELDPKGGRGIEALEKVPEADWGYTNTDLCYAENKLYFRDASSLFSYSLANEKWRKNARLLEAPDDNGRDTLAGLCYANKGLYSLFASYPEASFEYHSLRKYSLDGKLLKSLKLSRSIGSEFACSSPIIDLQPFGKYLIAILGTDDLYWTGKEFSACFYVFEPDTGKVVYVGAIEKAGGVRKPGWNKNRSR